MWGLDSQRHPETGKTAPIKSFRNPDVGEEFGRGSNRKNGPEDDTRNLKDVRP